MSTPNLFPSRNGSFSAERRSPRVSACGVPMCTPQRKPLCGLAQRKNPSFLNWKFELTSMVAEFHFWMGTNLFPSRNGSFSAERHSPLLEGIFVYTLYIFLSQIPRVRNEEPCLPHPAFHQLAQIIPRYPVLGKLKRNLDSIE